MMVKSQRSHSILGRLFQGWLAAIFLMTSVPAWAQTAQVSSPTGNDPFEGITSNDEVTVGENELHQALEEIIMQTQYENTATVGRVNKVALFQKIDSFESDFEKWISDINYMFFEYRRTIESSGAVLDEGRSFKLLSLLNHYRDLLTKLARSRAMAGKLVDAKWASRFSLSVPVDLLATVMGYDYSVVTNAKEAGGFLQMVLGDTRGDIVFDQASLSTLLPKGEVKLKLNDRFASDAMLGAKAARFSPKEYFPTMRSLLQLMLFDQYAELSQLTRSREGIGIPNEVYDMLKKLGVDNEYFTQYSRPNKEKTFRVALANTIQIPGQDYFYSTQMIEDLKKSLSAEKLPVVDKQFEMARLQLENIFKTKWIEVLESVLQTWPLPLSELPDRELVPQVRKAAVGGTFAVVFSVLSQIKIPKDNLEKFLFSRANEVQRLQNDLSDTVVAGMVQRVRQNHDFDSDKIMQEYFIGNLVTASKKIFALQHAKASRIAIEMPVLKLALATDLESMNLDPKESQIFEGILSYDTYEKAQQVYLAEVPLFKAELDALKGREKTPAYAKAKKHVSDFVKLGWLTGFNKTEYAPKALAPNQQKTFDLTWIDSSLHEVYRQKVVDREKGWALLSVKIQGRELWDHLSLLGGTDVSRIIEAARPFVEEALVQTRKVLMQDMDIVARAKSEETLAPVIARSILLKQVVEKSFGAYLPLHIAFVNKLFATAYDLPQWRKYTEALNGPLGWSWVQYLFQIDIGLNIAKAAFVALPIQRLSMFKVFAPSKMWIGLSTYVAQKTLHYLNPAITPGFMAMIPDMLHQKLVQIPKAEQDKQMVEEFFYSAAGKGNLFEYDTVQGLQLGVERENKAFWESAWQTGLFIGANGLASTTRRGLVWFLQDRVYTKAFKTLGVDLAKGEISRFSPDGIKLIAEKKRIEVARELSPFRNDLSGDAAAQANREIKLRTEEINAAEQTLLTAYEKAKVQMEVAKNDFRQTYINLGLDPEKVGFNIEAIEKRLGEIKVMAEKGEITANQWFMAESGAAHMIQFSREMAMDYSPSTWQAAKSYVNRKLYRLNSIGRPSDLLDLKPAEVSRYWDVMYGRVPPKAPEVNTVRILLHEELYKTGLMDLFARFQADTPHTMFAGQPKNYYDVLGVKASSTNYDVRKAYRKLVRQFHPNLNPGNTAALARYEEIVEAFQVLSNPEARAIYDYRLKEYAAESKLQEAQ